MTAAQPSIFGDLLRRRRLAAGLTQEELAERAGLSTRAISDLERGINRKPRKDTIQRLAEALHLSAQDRATFVASARGHIDPPASVETLPRHPHNLPSQPNVLIGRDREVAAACAFMRRSDVHLLTLTGPGGTGKTRLGLQVAAALLGDFVDGVFFVPLAPLRDPALVASTIGQSLGVREAAGQALPAALQAYLQDKHLLLVLDNFEQVLPAAALLSDLLTAAPGLKVLVTSRATLHLSHEHQFPVSPLALPPGKHSVGVEALSQYAAVALFIHRALVVKPDFVVTPASAPALAEICQRLDGLPLAIELAAARTRLLPPQALLARLAHRLPLLTGGSRDLPARHQTLRATIEWSFDLLDASEQRLFARLAMFAGGWTVEAAERVCAGVGSGADAQVDQVAVLDGLASLRDQSLVQQEPALDPEDEPRFTMLETIREYALERLAANGETEETSRRHAGYYLALAEAAEPELRGPAQGVWLTRLETEHDNLRAALHWSLESGAEETALRLGGALWRFWYMHGHLSEGRRWLEMALAKSSAVPASVQAKVFNGAGNLAYGQSDYARAAAWHEASLALQRDLGDKAGLAASLTNLGNIAWSQGDYVRAQAF